MTGGADDDPSGIATYSQAGAQFGLATLWVALLTFPLMVSVQEMCARIGLVTSSGLMKTLKDHYSKKILYLMILFSFPAVILNIGADIASMGAVAHLLLPSVHANIFSGFFTLALLGSLIFFSYQKIASVLKYLCVTLLVYLIVPFLSAQDWSEILKRTFLPTLQWNKDFLSILVAVLGTTISPYLFFWQATMEVESISHRKTYSLTQKIIKNMRLDISCGMFFSNLVMYFIILTTGTVLFGSGIHQIDTVEQAAKALEPLAGHAAYLLFAVGILSTGFLAIPVLCGSIAYMLAEAFDWNAGLDKKFREARAFYVVITVSLIAGFAINFMGISPIQALIYSAMLYGITSPVIIAIIIHISNNKSVMGEHKSGKISNILAGLTFILMTAAVIDLFVS